MVVILNSLLVALSDYSFDSSPHLITSVHSYGENNLLLACFIKDKLQSTEWEDDALSEHAWAVSGPPITRQRGLLDKTS